MYCFSPDFIFKTTILAGSQHGKVLVLFKSLIMSKTSGTGCRICMYLPQQVGSRKPVRVSKHIIDFPRMKISLLLFHYLYLSTILDSRTSRNITHHSISVKSLKSYFPVDRKSKIGFLIFKIFFAQWWNL